MKEVETEKLPIKVVKTLSMKPRACPFLGRARDLKQPQRKSKRVNVQISHRTERSPLSSPHYSPPNALSTWGKRFPWFRTAKARSSRAGSCPGPFLPLCSYQKLQGLWAPQPKSQGLLRREKNQNPTPSHVHLPQQNSSETNLHWQPFLHNFESPNILPTAPQRVPTPDSWMP